MTESPLLQNIALIAATVVLVGVGLAVINFARREAKGEMRSEEDILALFRSAYEAGEMDSAEFERIRASLTGRKGAPPPAAKPKTTGLEDTLLDAGGHPEATLAETEKPPEAT